PAAGRLRLPRFHLLPRCCTGSGRSRAARIPREPGRRDTSRIADDLGLCAMTSLRVSVQATRVRPGSRRVDFGWVLGYLRERVRTSSERFPAGNVSLLAMCRECLLPGNLGGAVVRPQLAELSHTRAIE